MLKGYVQVQEVFEDCSLELLIHELRVRRSVFKSIRPLLKVMPGKVPLCTVWVI
jgi:hypothetical protein